MMQQKVKTTRAPGLRLDKNRRLTPMQIYCWATVVCLAVLLLALLASRGALLHRFFFYDVTDTGMDFFHSIEYMRGRMPYGQFDTLYPPLANLFFYVLYLLVPKTQSATWTESFISSLNMKGTERDLRLQQATMMLFIVFVIVVVLGIVSMTERLTRSCGGAEKAAGILCSVQLWGTVRLGTWQYSAAVLAVNGIFYPVPQFRKPTFAGVGLSGTCDCRRFQAVPGVSGRAVAAR